MADSNSTRDLADALSAPLGDLIGAVGRGVADAQQALDAKTIELLRRLYMEEDDDLLKTLRRLGYQPTWYRIPEVDTEVVVSLSVSGDARQALAAGEGSGSVAAGGGNGRLKLYAAPIDATYQNKYGFNLRAASKVKFKIVPVPPSTSAAAMKAVPNLVGKRFAAAKELLEEMGFLWKHMRKTEPAETAVISKQVPEAGTIVEEDNIVILTFRR